MKDQFVTYEIAKAINELGFNEECFTYYFQNQVTGEWELHAVESDSVWSNDSQKPFMSAKFAAPLWQQVVDWLREGHLVIILVTPFSKFLKPEWEYDLLRNKISVFEQPKKTGYNAYIINNDFIFQSYKQAREAAILKALELITK